MERAFEIAPELRLAPEEGGRAAEEEFTVRYKALCEECGWQMEPVLTVDPHGVRAELRPRPIERTK